MNWKLIKNKSNTGQYNMDFDVDLTKQCGTDGAFLRFYQWEPYCISLGANQKISDINVEKSESDGIDIVKRPTGGRAILHAEELTYSAVVPLNSGLTNREIYTKISLALVRGLKIYDHKLNAVELENVQPNFPSLLDQPSGVLCFASTAKSEVKYKGKKLIGSAQRKMDSVVLQHGSILCGKFHCKLPEYLNVENSEVELLNAELTDKTTEIETITNEKIDFDKLESALIRGFEEEWNINF